MDIVVDPQLKAYIDPLTPDEHDALERSILAEGCRDALVLWGDILIDGHNRHGICVKHGLPFQTVQNTRFQSMEDVHLWMIEQHLGRRSVSDFQRGVLALRKREILDARKRVEQEQLRRESEGEVTAEAAPDEDAPPWEAAPTLSRAELARQARLSGNQVAMIEKIHSQAAAEVIDALKAGTISISAAAAVAALPEEEQRAAAAGGKDELKQAAKRVRESKRRPRKDDAEGADASASPSTSASTSAPHQADDDDALPEGRAGEVMQALRALGEGVPALRERVVALTLENDALRQQLADLRRSQDVG